MVWPTGTKTRLAVFHVLAVCKWLLTVGRPRRRLHQLARISSHTENDSIKAVALVVASDSIARLGIQSLAANILNFYQVFEANRALVFSHLAFSSA